MSTSGMIWLKEYFMVSMKTLSRRQKNVLSVTKLAATSAASKPQLLSSKVTELGWTEKRLMPLVSSTKSKSSWGTTLPFGQLGTTLTKFGTQIWFKPFSREQWTRWISSGSMRSKIMCSQTGTIWLWSFSISRAETASKSVPESASPLENYQVYS